MSEPQVLHRKVVKAREVVVGDRIQVGGYISPVNSISSITSDPNYVCINGIIPAKKRDDDVVIWTPRQERAA